MDEADDRIEDAFLESTPQRFQTFFAALEELESESDRGVAILGISLLDYRIQELLLHLLVPIKGLLLPIGRIYTISPLSERVVQKQLVKRRSQAIKRVGRPYHKGFPC